jgi:ankyrin repeat protein
MIAMTVSKFEIVNLLLEHGANPQDTDTMGNDAFLVSLVGRTSNMKPWLERFPNWNVERYNNILETRAFSFAVYLGPNRVDAVKLLLRHGTNPNITSGAGSSIFMDIGETEDGDPEILKLLLKIDTMKKTINNRRRGRTFMWRCIHRLARFLTWSGFSKSGLMKL